MPPNRVRATVLLLALCVGTVLAARSLRPHPEELLKQRLAARSLGDEKAPFWITEYFDYQCPPCANAAGLLAQAIEEHPGQIYLQVRHFPLPAHKNALKAALYGECASRQSGKFWKFHEELFKHQNEWAQDPYAPIRFSEYAQRAGLDVKALDACSHDPEVEKTVLDEKKKGEELGVKITPSFFINGKLAVGIGALKESLKAHFEKDALPEKPA